MNDYLELHSLYHHGIKGQKWGVRRFQNYMTDKKASQKENKEYISRKASIEKKIKSDYKSTRKQRVNSELTKIYGKEKYSKLEKQRKVKIGKTKAVIALGSLGVLTVGAIKVNSFANTLNDLTKDIASLVEIG